MTSPSVIYEQEKLTLYSTKVQLAGDMLDKNLISRKWIYKNIFNFSDVDISDIEMEVIEDQKTSYRHTQISEEGSDPADPINREPEEDSDDDDESKDLSPKTDVNQKLQKDYDKRSSKERKTPEVPDGGWEDAGRPREGIKYNSHEHPLGYDPIGKVAWNNARNRHRNESFADNLKLTKLSSSSTRGKKLIKESSILDESNIIDEDI